MLSVTELQVPDLAYEEFIVEQTFITENKRIRKRTQEQHCSYYLQERMGGAKVERQLKNREYMALLATARNNNKPTITKVPTHPPPLPSTPYLTFSFSLVSDHHQEPDHVQIRGPLL
jgi:hypothetical protein